MSQPRRRRSRGPRNRAHLRRPLRERLYAKIDVGAPDACWPWLGSTAGTNRGRYGPYGYLRRSAPSKARVGAHVAAYELEHGPVPPGLEVHHWCHNTLCCNPAHLQAVPHSANIQAGFDLKARYFAPTTYRGRWAPPKP